MAKLIYVYCTLASSVIYQLTETGENGIPRAVGEVHVKGGAGVMGEHLQTPKGVPTLVTAEQVEMLKKNEVFQLHEKNGYVTISDEKDVEKAIADMQQRDVSAPLVDEDFKEGEKPTTAAPKK